MASKDEQGREGIFGRGMPGTGGDLRITDDEPDIEGLGADEDTEGHLYTGGPKTQGEFTRRGPGENPHGER